MSNQSKNPIPVATEPVDSAGLLEIIDRYVLELQEDYYSVRNIHLDTLLDRDLGLDSISRMELIARIETGLGVWLAESMALDAQTPRELLQAIRRPDAASADHADIPQASLLIAQTTSQIIPDQMKTLNQVLQWHAEHNPDRIHVLFLGEHGHETAYTYQELYRDGLRVAAALIDCGLQPEESVAIMLPVGIGYLQTFCGILLAGAVPVPIYPPARPHQLEDHILRHAKLLTNAHARLLVTFDRATTIARLLATQVKDIRQVVTVEQLLTTTAIVQSATVVADATAFLQYTSGSTGQPKGVVLSHANVLASLRSMGRALQVNADDVFVSWLPLYHDLGLIGAWLGSLYHGLKLVLMSPLTFLAHPQRWLEAITTYRGTLSGGPNFSYDLCVRRVSEEVRERLDLSSWRIAFNGAEPVNVTTLQTFGDRFKCCGFSDKALKPVYGLAEATLGVTLTPVDRGPRWDWIDANQLHSSGRALPQTATAPGAIAQVSCGIPIPGFEVRIADDSGDELADREVGQVQFRGVAATSGYFHNPEASQALFDHDWLRSGDRGYVADSELYITGRDKDLIIRAGRNIYPYDMEAAVGRIDGVRSGCVAVFGCTSKHSGMEGLVVVAETRERDPEARTRIKQAISATGTQLLDLEPSEIVLVPTHTVLKTSSGKIRRSAVRELYQRGNLGRSQRVPWLQIARLTLVSLFAGGKKTLNKLKRVAHVGLVITVTVPIVIVAWLLVNLPISLNSRWYIGNRGSGILLRLAGIHIRVSGVEHLLIPQTKVLVSNHASYLDALLLTAVSPVPVAFVAKSEIRKIPLVGNILTRLGIQFVDRLDTRSGVSMMQSLVDLLQQGRFVGFFPEGTFHRMPGLLPFRIGAFVCAAKSNAVVIPITLRGNRSVLRGDDWILRRGVVQVYIDEPISPITQGTFMEQAIALRKQVRTVILARCGEPDMGDRHDVFDDMVMGSE